MDGWIKLHRKLLDTSFYGNPLTVALFIHCLLKANHKDKKILWNGKEIVITRGSFVTGLKVLSKETGISIQSIRTAFVNLKSTNTLTIKTTTKFRIVTILNYEQYQALTIKLTNKQQTSNKQATTNKNEKNDRNKEEYTHINFLKQIPSNDLEELFKRIQATRTQIQEKADDLYNYCQAKGRVYKNYKAFLINALKRDFGVRTIHREGVSIDGLGGNKKIPRPV
jgi:hypothetical protein